MKRPWIFLLPLFFLPNVFLPIKTGFGSLEISDFLVIPFIFATYLDRNGSRFSFALRPLTQFAVIFALWTLLTILLIAVKFDYADPGYPLSFSFLKWAKMCLFAFAGFRVIKIVQTDSDRDALNMSLLMSAVVISGTLLLFSYVDFGSTYRKSELFKGLNLMSTVLAIIFAYLVSLFLSGRGTSTLRMMSVISLPVIALGFAYSEGRGGWVAAFFALVYHFFKRGKSAWGVAQLVLTIAAPIVFYQISPSFRFEVERTLYENTYGGGTQTISSWDKIGDGHRLDTWIHEGKKLAENSVTGTGFYHRGGESRLFTSGSHNYWLQIVLETGVVGGVIVLLLLYHTWVSTGHRDLRREGLTVPLRSALIAAFISGLSGEYFYGGLGLFTLLAVMGTMTYTQLDPKINQQDRPHPEVDLEQIADRA